ncbi:Ig-like domain-containing protein [Gimesia chilikensis]|uniref:Ig-like domain-containing protein n=1 Tax=Gimesia chilikensis TaxID=2605989 RepID=UPI00165903D8|nr:Ig-like domain-containing protein [Gimesia chilikensis]
MSRPIGYASHVERLEDRTLLASNILASLESSVNQPNDSTELLLTVGAGSSPTLGFEVHASPGSAFNPAAVQILDANTNAVVPLQLAEHDHAGTSSSLVLATLAPGDYAIFVQGQTAATGNFTIDIFMPGDSDGSGSVSDTEYQQALAASYQHLFGFNHFTSQMITSMGLDPTQNYYSEEQDSDKDGDIDNYDLQMMNNNRNVPTVQLELIGDQDAPAVVAGLEVDSGASDSDGITNELTIVGTVSDESLITKFKVALDGGSYVNIFGLLSSGANGGTFTLSRSWLETNLNGGASLEGGTHTLHFWTMDEHDNVSPAGAFDVNFELDTIAPTTATPIGNQTLNEDFGSFNLGPFTDFFNQNGGTSLSYRVDSITNAIVNFDFATDELILTSRQDVSGSADIVIQAIDVAGNAVLSNTFTVTVNAVNDPPVAVNDEYTTNNEDDVFNAIGPAAVIANDTDVENDTLTVVEVNGSSVDVGNEITIGAGGKLTLESDGSFSFNPDGFYNYLAVGETATETFTYKISDGNGGTDTASVTITIHGANDAPVAQDDDFTITQNETLHFNFHSVISDNGNGADYDPDTSDSIEVTAVNGSAANVGNEVVLASGASLTLFSGGGIAYQPNGVFDYLALGENATETFTYTLSDGNGGTDTATVTITITGVNDDPVANPNTILTVGADEDNPVSTPAGAIFEFATDAEDDSLLITEINGSVGNVGATISIGLGGLLTANADGSFTFDPNDSYDFLAVGESYDEAFTYKISDGNGGTDGGTYTIRIHGINDAPIAENDEFATNQDTPASGDLFADNGNGVDSDPDSTDSFTVSEVNGVSASVGSQITLGSGALLTVNANGTFDYDPNGAFDYLIQGDHYFDSFDYTIDDGNGGTSIATVTMDVLGLNDAPVVSNDSLDADEDGSAVTTGVLGTDIDLGATLTYQITLQPSEGTAYSTGNGTLTFDPGSDFQDLAAGETRQVTFNFTAKDDNNAVSNTGTVTVTVTGVNDEPTVSAAVTTTATEDDVSFSLDLLTNASDVDTTDVLNVSNLVLDSGDDSGITVNGNSLDIDPSAYNYLAVGESAVITYTYNVIDGEGGSVVQTATITITGVNDAPAVSAAVTTTATEDDSTFSLNLLTNASDPDTTDVLNVSGLSLDSGDDSGITVNGNSLDIDPSAYNYLAVGESAVIVYSYNIIDGEGGTVPQTATITITGVNDAPVVSAAVSTTATEDDGTFSLDLLTNASDPDTTDVLNVSGLTLDSGDDSGITVNGNSLDIDPSAYNYLAVGESAVITYSYNVIDGEGGSVAQTATITITGVNDAPAVSAAVTTTATEDDLSFSLDLLTNASDPDTTDVLNVSGLSLDSGDDSGITINGNSLDIDPSAYNYLAVGESAVITYTYNVIDGEGGTVPQTATITITGVNDAPAVSAAVSTTATEDDGSFSLDLLTNASDPDTTDVLNVSGLTLDSGDASGITVNGNSLDIDPSAYNYLAVGESAVITYSYNVIDGEGGSVAQTATITITGVNDAPVAQDDAVDVNKEQEYNGNVFANNGSGVDSDPDTSDTFDVTEVNGQTAAVNTEITLGSGALLTVNDDGSFTYDPNGQFDGLTGLATATDSFNYTIDDGNGGVDVATVTLTISANQAPIANIDIVATNEDTELTNIDVLANDTDPDGDDNNLTVFGLPSMTSNGGAALTLNMDGTISYDPTVAYNYLSVGETAVDTFTYTVEDERGGFATGTVQVTVTGVNDAPTVSAPVVSASNEDAGGFSVNLLDNASDVDTNDTLTIQNLVQTNAGNAGGITPSGTSLSVDPSFYSYLSVGESEVITYSYEVIDGNGGVVSQTASITIDGRNDAPIVSMGVESIPTEDDGVYALNLLSHASDIDQSDTLLVANLTKTSGDDSGIVVNGNLLQITPNAYNSLAAGETAVIEYSYNVIDGNGGSVAQTATITVLGVNDDPTASILTITSAVTEDDGSYSIDLLQNVSDDDTTDVLSATNIVKFSGNNVGITVNGNSLDIDPSAYGYLAAGEDAVIVYHYDVTDSNGGTVQLIASITISGANDAPVAAPDAFGTNEDTVLNGGNVLDDNGSGADSDIDASNTISVTGISDGGGAGSVGSAFTLVSGAVVTLQSDGTFTYDPNNSFEDLAVDETVTDSFTYTLSDGTATDTATVTITITGVNDPPVAAADEFSTTQDFALTGENLFDDNSNGEDTDVDFSDVLTVIGIGQGVNTGTVGSGFTLASGAVVTVLADGTFDYDPNGAFDYLGATESASDTFTYIISDGNGGTDSATVTVFVYGQNDPPEAVDDAVTTNEDTTLPDGDVFIDNGSGVDSDVDTNDTLTVVGVSEGGNTGSIGSGFTLASGAIVTMQADGKFSYNPNNSFEYLADGESTTDSFTYTISDGTVTDTATVTITIDGVNDDPVAVHDRVTTDEDTTLVGADVFVDNNFGVDSDVDASDILTVIGVSQGMTTGSIGSGFTLASGAIVTMQSNGTFTYNPNGAFEYLAVGETATDSFTYTISDGNGGTDSASVDIQIDGVNDAPVISAPVTSTSTEDDGSVNVDLLTNTTDVDATDTLSVINLLKTNAGNDGGITMTTASSWDIDTSFYGYLAAGESEVITYSYDITDNNGETVSQTLTITINGVNDDPVAQADAFQTDEETTLTGVNVFSDNGSGADADGDASDSFTVTGINQGGSVGSVGGAFMLSSGAAVTIQSTGALEYDPNGAFEYLAVGESATETFTYTITDEEGGTSTATVTVTIQGVNDPVDAVNDDVTTSKDVSLNFDVRLDNGNGPDLDPDTNDNLSVFEITDTTLGTVNATVGNAITLDSGATVTLQADGTLTYNPNGQFASLILPTDTATDTFTYTIRDGNGSSDTATVTMTITGSNEDLVQTAPLDDVYSDGLSTVTIDLDNYFNDPDASDDITYTLLSSGSFAANFWVESVSITDNILEITFTDYASDQERLPTDITLRAESTDGISPTFEPTFQLIPDPQQTMEIRLIATPTLSGGRDFTYFRAEGGLGSQGRGLFHLTNGNADLEYSIYLTDYEIDLDGSQTGTIDDDVKSVRLVDTTNGNAVVYTIYNSVGADDSPILDLTDDSLHGTFAAGEGFNSTILDKLYDGSLAIRVELDGTGGTINKLSGANITVSPEVADVGALPAETTQYVEGASYNIEIWISDQLAQVLAAQTTENSSITSVVLDLLWDDTTAAFGDFADVTGVASAFRLLTQVGGINNATGVIEDFSGITLMPGMADGYYARVGYATFIANAPTADADPVEYTVNITPGEDLVNRGTEIDLSQIDIIGTSVSHFGTSEFLIQTDMTNINIEGKITIDGQEVTLTPQDLGLDSTTVSGRLDVLFDDVDNPSTIQILDSFIEVNPSGLALPDRTAANNDRTTEELADFGLEGVLSNFNGTGNPADLSVAIRDALVQVLTSTQALDGSGNFNISENWNLTNGDLYSMLVVPNFGNFVASDTVESTAGETMSFFDPGAGVPAGLTDWSQAKLTEISTGLYELVIPVSRVLNFNTEAGYPVELKLTGYATARFLVDQETTDQYGDTIGTAHATGLDTSSAATTGTNTYYGGIGNNTSIADPLLDVDMFQVYLEAGDSVIVDIDASQFETGLDSVVRIFDAAGNEVAYSDDDLAPDENFVSFLSNFDSYVTYTNTTGSAGNFFIGISAYNDLDDPVSYDPTDTAGRPTGVDPSDVGSYDLHITVQNGAAPLHGTQAVITDASLEDGTAVDLAVVRDQTQLDAYGQTSSLPTSDTWIDEWSSFWVEIYVETADAQGITAAIADLNYNTDFFTATAIEFGTAFADNGQAIIDDATGVVTGLSGTAQYEKAGHLKKALLARVKFESLEQDDVSIDFEDKFIGPHALGLSLSNVSVSLTDDTETTLLVGDAPETDLWAIAYDVNDDDVIDFKDLTILASVYNQNVLDTDSPYVWALDADKSGDVNFKDLTFFATNYGVSKGGDRDVVYPSNFLQRWYGKTTNISGDSSIDQVMDTALSIWQDALGMDEPLDIQLVITDLGGTQLGEGQITAVDEQGRPVAGIVTLDDDAAGLGWYSDISTTAFGGGELEGGVSYTADINSDAVGHYDLLTVLLHEIGHVAGFTDTYAPFESHVQVGVGGTLSFVGNGFEATLTDDGLHLDDSVHDGDVMNATLDPGVRKLPSILDALILQTAHETAASGDFEILVGVNAPLMANLPLTGSDETVLPEAVQTLAPLVELAQVSFDATGSQSDPAGSNLPVIWNQVWNTLNQLSQGAEPSELDLTLLEGLNEEFVQSLREHGLSIIESGEILGHELSELDPADWQLTGLDQDGDGNFDEVFSDWAGPIL